METILVVAVGLFAVIAFVNLFSWGVDCRLERRRRKRARSASGVLSWNGGERRRALSRRQKEAYELALERHVPEMIDALALGMRAGMSFERAFRSYCFRFDDELALLCRQACLKWESGLVSRDDALLELGVASGVTSLERFASNAVRCLRFGSPMNRMLEALASEARGCYRAKMEEKVAKAPVKMLVPTAVLILPAMLIVVMAPVFLGFVQ